MRNLFRALVLTALLSSTMGIVPARSQSPELAALQRETNELLAQGRQAEAIGLAQRSLHSAKARYGEESPATAAAMFLLATAYMATSQLLEAEALLTRSLAIRQRTLGAEHADVGWTLRSLAKLYKMRGAGLQAAGVANRVVPIFEKAYGPQHLHVATALHDLAMSSFVSFIRAEPLLARAVIIREAALGSDHPDVAKILDDFATLHAFKGRRREAESIFQRAIAAREKSLGPLHPDVSQSLNKLAILYFRQGRSDEAEPLFRRALAIREAALGPDHPYARQTAIRLSMLYFAQDDWHRALAFWRDPNLISLTANPYEEGFSATDWPGMFSFIRIYTGGESDAYSGPELTRQFIYATQIKAGARRALQDLANYDRHMMVAFQSAQSALRSGIETAIAEAAARHDRGGSAFAELLRERQDLSREGETLRSLGSVESMVIWATGSMKSGADTIGDQARARTRQHRSTNCGHQSTAVGRIPRSKSTSGGLALADSRGARPAS